MSRLSQASVLLLATLASLPARADLVYVAEVPGYIVTYNTAGGGPTTFDSRNGVTGPAGIAFDSSGNLYVANNGNNTIEKITPNGTPTLFSSTGVNDPQGLAVDSSGNVYVANYGNNTIEKYTPSGAASLFATTAIGTSPATGASPVGLAVDSSGNVYVACDGNATKGAGTIEKITPGGVVSVFATGLSNPTGLAFDSSGNLYVANGGVYFNNPAPSIIEYTPSGGSSTFATTGVSDPFGLAFDSSGNLYVANEGTNTIEVFPPGGGTGSVFATPLNGVTFLAVGPQSVPEPSSLVLTGTTVVLGLGLAWRRRVATTRLGFGTTKP